MTFVHGEFLDKVYSPEPCGFIAYKKNKEKEKKLPHSVLYFQFCDMLYSMHSMNQNLPISFLCWLAMFCTV